MKIASIEHSHHRLPLNPSFQASWDGRERRHFDATIVRVRTDEGLEGVGSGDSMPGFRGHEDLFLGCDPLDLERHHQVISNLSFHYGRCWPLDLALWDLAGKIRGVPVWKLVGGRSNRVRAYASSGVLRDREAMADLAERYCEAGFPAIKVRFRRGAWRDDIRVLEAVRSRVGNRLELMVDCNQGWRMPWDTEAPWTFDEALPVARELERLGVYWMEEPLHRSDREGMRRLRDSCGVRIAGGEMAREVHDLRDLIIDGCVDVVQPDAALIGGITGLRPIVELAESKGVTFTPHTWTNGLGLLANVHLTAGLADAPFIEFPFDPPEWSLERRDFMLSEPLHVDAGGWIVLDDSRGFGVSLDEAVLTETQFHVSAD
jgi:L-alanine-DL-glutamate epimerase-like enolase superfamily enzyme